MLLFRRFDFFPLGYYLLRRFQTSRAEHVRMTAHQLLVDVTRHVIEVEMALFLRDTGVEHHLN